MPKQSSKSTATTFEGYGYLKAFLVANGIPYIEIRPAAWKKEAGLLKKDKADSVNKAKQMFPSAELQTPRGRLLDGRAEALLMAEQCMHKYSF